MNSTITIVGNVTRDPELRFTGSGLATATFGVAVNRKLPPRVDGSAAEAVTFFNVVAWQSLAENAAESLAKGNRVVVSGRLEQRSWETAEGDRRTIYELVADEIGPSLRWVTAKLTRIERIAPATPSPSPDPGEGPGARDAGSPPVFSDGSTPGGSAAPPPAHAGRGREGAAGEPF
jgi:single-strand DNA-binding protein